MATLNRLTLFLRVFLVTLILGQPSRLGAEDTEEQEAWNAARSLGTAAGFYAYISKYPTGTYIEDALTALNDLGAISTKRATRNLPNLQEVKPSTAPVAKPKSKAKTKPTQSPAVIAAPTDIEPSDAGRDIYQ